MIGAIDQERMGTYSNYYVDSVSRSSEIFIQKSFCKTIFSKSLNAFI